jgi:hypothetical protein
MLDDKQPANLGKFTPALPSPKLMLVCPKCNKKHDGIGSKKWIKGTKLMICAACVNAKHSRNLMKSNHI